MLKLDILVLAVHPDDAELGCSGTLLKHASEGKKVGIVDLTRGELGTRGTAETRDEEAADAAKILGLDVRENLKMPDGFFQNDEENRLKIIKTIRQYQPEIIITNAITDRHPDHGRAGQLVNDATFLSGLIKIKTEHAGVEQEAWRPKLVLQFIQDYYIKPDIIIDVTDYWDKKMASIQAYKTQFYHPEYNEDAETYISSPEFIHIIEGRAREFGKNIGVKYGEGFTCKRQLGVNNLFNLL
ncbi:bacillithiol biosynthesis deacetylase BshB1 [Pedobacter sp. HMF7647]|uniref:Bacillithiol biosynthesis deacetylase BshB1 n=1 Tax=Hufsiella arboris TaxID=2695275 RepID=A0A7K1YB62_9SPHI|nr:bacillithiol biosynthesis deacetylase BshB1 [Hufsiella arboris]MXV51339.1 bacillithiol biosynthesis deacetylase BshB1 [Hufsiella arboris]